MLPNGIALLPDGSFLLANLGDHGGVWRLYRDGQVEPFLLEVGGRALPPCNFVMLDQLGRVWITVSTRLLPRSNAFRMDVADGFIVMVDDNGARVVADHLGYTNEAQFDAAMEWLYVNETFGRRLSRFRVAANGQLHGRETVMEFGAGTFPDGLGFDQEGGVWVVSIVSNRVFRISQGRHCEILVEDNTHEHLELVETALQNGSMDKSHFETIQSSCLRNISSIAFGGPNLREAWLGCLLGNQLAVFTSPWAGVSPVHWNWSHPE
jgi:sugar lactone lactonase YvrE